MSNMLADAIVDAKALKEAAMKTAEESLMEKYAPQIQEAVMNILEQEEDELDPMMMGDMGPDMGAGEMSGMVNDVPLGATDGENLCPCPDDEEEIEINFSELERQLAAEEDAEEMGHEDLAQDLLGIEPEMGDEEELDLTEEQVLEAIKETLTSEEIEEGMWAKRDDEEEALEENVFDPSVLKDAKKKKDEEDKAREKQSHKKLKEGKEKNKELLSEVNKLKKEKAKLVNDYTKLADEVKKLKSALLETAKDLKTSNLSNAKLFYTNQVLKSDSLNERQKDKIVETVSNAGSVDEAKTLYETLKDSMGSGRSSKKEPKSLSEAVEKRSVMRLSSKKENNVNDGLANRWQKMAGIKK